MAIPFRKSRRVMARSMPRSRSRASFIGPNSFWARLRVPLAAPRTRCRFRGHAIQSESSRLHVRAGCRFLLNLPHHPEAGASASEGGGRAIRALGWVKKKLGCVVGQVEEVPSVDHGHTGNVGIGAAVEPFPRGHGPAGNTGVLQLGFCRETIFLP